MEGRYGYRELLERVGGTGGNLTPDGFHHFYYVGGEISSCREKRSGGRRECCGYNEAYNVERRRDIYLSPEMEPAKFIQVSSALSVVKSSEPTFPH